MASGNQAKGDLISKDAMYLFEFLRNSPQPILLHISPYAESTGTKPNTIVKRLGEIKKRNGLNIATTTAPPDHSKVVSTPKSLHLYMNTKPDTNDQATPNNKRKASAKTPKKAAPKNEVKVEQDEATATSAHAAATGLPSPAASASEPSSDAAMPANVGVKTELGAAPSTHPALAAMTAPTATHQQIPINSFMSQKRPIVIDDDDDDDDQNQTIKRAKKEDWSF